MTENKDINYVASLGESDQERLALQHECYASGTQHFLDSIAIKSGMHVLVVGCGAGNETMMIANKVGLSGKVTAIDISAQQIAVAQQKINKQNIKNVDFLVMAAEDLNQLEGKFDLAYTRMVLVHLKNPEKVLKLMLANVKPGGILACEEPDISSAFCIPPSSAFNKHINLLCRFIKNNEADPDLGSKIFSLFHEVGCKSIKSSFHQPAIAAQRSKRAVLLSAESCAAQFIAQGLIKPNEMLDLILNIKMMWSAMTHSLDLAAWFKFIE